MRVIHEKCDPKLADDRKLPYTAYLVQYEVDGKETLVFENQSTYIPANSIHRLSNPGKIPLRIIEVQSGSYLEEDDIERFDDSYGRS